MIEDEVQRRIELGLAEDAEDAWRRSRTTS